jgi:23S rRNA (cytosine1962-C5)-methyltransferase
MKVVQTGASEGYELLDFGGGRKLERFGCRLVDRPALGKRLEKSQPGLWESAELIYVGERMNAKGGGWRVSGVEEWNWEEGWDCRVAGMVLRIQPQRTGQLGVFPEHWQQWGWFERLIAARRDRGLGTRILHLFAYTGATTLWMAKCGAEVTHVDAMRHAVQWGRENAEKSEMGRLPIRWIVEDARRYVSRELKRGSRYDLVLLDPPSYGHGRRGEAWEIHRDLVPLMRDCWGLLGEQAMGVVLTSHSELVSTKELRMEMGRGGGEGKGIETEDFGAFLLDRSGRRLECGVGIRFYVKGAKEFES